VQPGIPTPERRQHSKFSADQLAPGSPNGGVIRSRVKYLFTPKAQRRAMVEIALTDLQGRGLLKSQTAKQNVAEPTSLDKNLNPPEFDAIEWFSKVHADVEGKRGGTINYSGSTRSTRHDRLPYSDEEGLDRAEYAHVVSRLPEAYLAFLDWVSKCQWPECFDDLQQVPGKLRLARSMFNSEDDKYLRGSVDGYFKAICQSITHARAERQTLLARRAIARKEPVELLSKLR
jgi:hypothetical protein